MGVHHESKLEVYKLELALALLGLTVMLELALALLALFDTGVGRRRVVATQASMTPCLLIPLSRRLREWWQDGRELLELQT